MSRQGTDFGDDQLTRLVEDVTRTLGEVKARSRLLRAWDLLHQRDAEGNPAGMLPYTDAALAEFEAAHRNDPDDVGIAHHLAVAQHARAWDLELAGDPQAPQAWAEALGYWRDVANSTSFWAAMEQKLRACDPDADPAVLTDARRNLLEHLLDIHVDFVRYYCEQNDPGRAESHVKLINQARIKPVLRKRLTSRVFEAMTVAAAEAKAQRAFASALATIERFLGLFPEYAPALAMHVEFCAEWVTGLSYKDDWDAITNVSQRAEPFARRLAEHSELAGNHLARAALEALASELGQRGYDRTHAHLQNQRDYQSLSVQEREELRAGMELAITWGRLAHRHCPSGSPVRELYVISLLNRAVFLHEEAMEVEDADIDDQTKAATRASLYREGVARMEEGLACAPEHEGLKVNLPRLRQALEYCERELTHLKTREAFNQWHQWREES